MKREYLWDGETLVKILAPIVVIGTLLALSCFMVKAAREGDRREKEAVAARELEEQQEEQRRIDFLHKLCWKWEKVDESAFVIEFTRGAHVMINDGDSTYQTRYSIDEKWHISIWVKNLSVKVKTIGGTGLFDQRITWYAQTFKVEILSTGELLISDYKGPYGSEPIIEKITGRYTSVYPTGDDATQVSNRIETCLAVIRSKAEISSSQFTRLTQDRESLVNRLRSVGVNSPTDLQRIPSAVPLASELTELVQQISSTERRYLSYTAMISQLESAKRRSVRQEDLVGIVLSEDDVHKIYTILKEVEEKLANLSEDELVRDLNIEVVLERELSR